MKSIHYKCMFLLILFVGCEVPEVDVEESAEGVSDVVSTELDSKTLSDSGEGRDGQQISEDDVSQTVSIDFSHPTSFEELKEIYTKAFNVGDKQAIYQLTYWADLTGENRSVTEDYLAGDAGKGTISYIRVNEEMADDDSIGEDFKEGLSSSQVWEIEYKTNSSTQTFDWLVGEIDGKYYFGAWAADK